MAAAGVGHIGIVDGDTVETSNLQRQIIHGTSTVGVSKCESARRRIHDINPHIRVRLYEEEFTSETALRILEGGFSENQPYQVVIDGSDNFPTKYLVSKWLVSKVKLLAFYPTTLILNDCQQKCLRLMMYAKRLEFR